MKKVINFALTSGLLPYSASKATKTLAEVSKMLFHLFDHEFMWDIQQIELLMLFLLVLSSICECLMHDG